LKFDEKLQKQKAREYKGKPIYKYVIAVPPQHIKELGWKQGQKLKGTIIKDKGYFLSLR
jgi:hypothetical protein